jgi:subfamily B ATP-binding cassette protein MsbA
MKRLLPYFRYLGSVKWHFIVGLLSALVYAGATGAGLPLMTKVVFPVLFKNQSPESLWYQKWMAANLAQLTQDELLLLSVLWIPLIFVVRSVAGYANAYLISYCGFRVLEGLRMDIFSKLQSLPLSFYHRHKSGDLMARLTGDAEVIRQVIAQTSNDLIKQPAVMVFALGYVVYESIQKNGTFVALIALLSIPLCVLPIRILGKKLARRAKSLQANQGGVSAMLVESISSPLEIRAYNLQERQKTAFNERIRRVLKDSMKIVKGRQAISPAIEVVAAVGFSVALYFGVRNNMTQTEFLALGMALFFAYEPVKKLGNIHSQLKQAEAALDRIEVILHAEDSLPDAVAPVALLRARGEVAFSGVSFSYDEGGRVLQNVNVAISPGECVALVGPSGAGKTTFANLIPRFYDTREGRVMLDGIDIRDFSKHDLRRQIAVVPQMPVLFNDTILENIRLGRLDATDDEVVTAARSAHAHDFILALENGYNTFVGERGGALSGGQRQRIALARAFLKDAPLLILDEATSALDAESEAMVQKALRALVKGRTTFIIAHRFSTISFASRILVFDRGQIVEDGCHESLRDKDSIYRMMAAAG